MATIKKAQKGKMTPMQQYKKSYPDADTTKRGDARFDELPPSIPAAAKRRDAAMRKAYDAKYGKGKPAMQKMGGVTKKKMKTGGAVKKGDLVAAGVTKTTKKAPMVDPKGAYTKVQQRTLGNMKKGGKMMSKKK